jgi:GNAT superfamily N-acetyltransferase
VSGPVEVVRLTPDDWESHRVLRLDALATDPEAFGATYADNAAYDEATWRARLAAVTYWQFRDSGMPLGMVGLWDPIIEGELGGPGEDEVENVPFVIAMFVRPAARGRGVGSALIEAVITEAGQRGSARLALDVKAGNAAARALYERHGFQVLPDAIAAQAREAGGCELTMVRPLP